MKRGLQFRAALIIFILLTLIASPFVTAEKSEAEVKRGGTAIASFMAKVTSLDPPNGNAFSGEGNVYIAMYDRLLRKDEAGNYVPELAKSWEFSEDGKQLTFHLRDDVTFHDGTPFNAEAAKFNLDRLLDPKEATQAYRFFTDMESIDIVDDNTIRINLKRPSSVILSALTYRGGFMLSPSAMEKYGEDYTQHPVGTGPFQFVEWIPGNRVKLARNENYWAMGEDGKPLPYLDGIDFKVITDDSVRLVELQSGNAQMVVRIPAESQQIVRDDPNVDLVQTPSATAYRLYLNMRRAPFDNTKLRQAINYAFDRETMAEMLVPGQGYVAPFVILPTEPEYSEYTPYNYDPEKAKQLLAEAGYPDGLDVAFMFISREPDRTIAPVVQSYLEAIGIRTKIESLDRLIYIEKAKSGNFDMSMAQITLPLPSLFLTLSQQLHSEGPVNRAAWKNKEFDALLDTLAVTFDPEEQKQILHELQRVCLDDAGQTFLFHRGYPHGHSKKVKDVEFQYEATWRFHNMWLDE